MTLQLFQKSNLMKLTRGILGFSETGTRSKHFLDFEIGDVFLLGSPLALVLAFRR